MSNKKSTKTHDIAIKVGEYEDGQGNKKGRYVNFGAVFEGENGPFLLLNSHMLPMELQYLANPKRQDKVIASMFEVKDKDDAGGKGQQKQNIQKGDGHRGPDFDDEIPF